MHIKKFILALFIIISLNFSSQPVTLYSKEKDEIVFVVNKDLHIHTSDFINKNEYRKFTILFSLTLKLLLINNSGAAFNTS